MFYPEDFYACLTDLLPEDDSEYASLMALQKRLLEEARRVGGDDLAQRLSEAREELRSFERRLYFLWGLRLGMELMLP